MLREFLSRVSLLELPIAAMLFFLLLFVAVVWRVSRRNRAPIYRELAQMPLDDRTERSLS